MVSDDSQYDNKEFIDVKIWTEIPHCTSLGALNALIMTKRTFLKADEQTSKQNKTLERSYHLRAGKILLCIIDTTLTLNMSKSKPLM